MLKFSLLLLVSMCLVTGIQGFGYTSPAIYALEDSPYPIEIECGINDLSMAEGQDSSSLYFNATCDNLPYRIFKDKPYIEILAKDKIKLKLPKTRSSKCNYTCRFPDFSVAFTTVHIGKPLGKVKNFQCRDQDWANMTCKFTEMDNNIKLKYELTYRISNIRNHKYTCNLTNDFHRGRSCEIYSKRDAFYKNTENYTFTLKTYYPESQYLSREPYTETFVVNHLAVVIPAAPHNLSVTGITTDSARLSWQMPQHIKFSSFELAYDLQIKSQYDTKWRPYPLESNGTKTEEASLKDLEYPYCDYDVRLRIKTLAASDEMYSQFVQTQFKTAGRRPDRPPQSTFGAFHVSDSDGLTIFWEQLDEQESNGPNLRYTLKVAENEQTFNSYIEPYKFKNMSAKFDSLAINKSNHTFTIASVNDIGQSSSVTRIFVPRKQNLLKVDLKLTRSHENNAYKLQWHYSGPDSHLIQSFTILSCQTKSELPNDCDGKLIFLNVSAAKTTTIYPADDQRMVNFAISANSAESTTGMIWTECLSNEADEIGKATTVYVPNNIVDARSFVVRWHVDCRDLSIIEHFQLEFCPVALDIHEEGDCIGMNNLIEIYDVQTREYQLKKLQPYTNYKIALRLISISNKTGNAVHTYERTKEAAPTPPLNLRFGDVTNNSVALTWDPPADMNGVLQYYRIFHFWGGHLKNQTDTNQTSYTLTDLFSYTDYNIIVTACTVECSTKSNDVNIMTKIGAPSQIQSISNDVNGVVRWSKPAQPGGTLAYYELRITSYTNGTALHRILRVRGDWNKCHLERLECEPKFDKHTIFVRGVNLATTTQMYFTEASNVTEKCEANEYLDNIDVEKFYGPWSNSVIEHFCNEVTDFKAVIGGIAMVILLVISMYGGIVGCQRIKNMKDIKACLPSALESIRDDPGLERKNDSEQMLIPREDTPRDTPSPIQSRVAGESVTYEEIHENGKEVEFRHSNSQQPLLENLVEKKDTSQTTSGHYVPMNKLPAPIETPYVQIRKGISVNGYIQNRIQTIKELHKPHLTPDPSIKVKPPVNGAATGDYIPHRLPTSSYVPHGC